MAFEKDSRKRILDPFMSQYWFETKSPRLEVRAKVEAISVRTSTLLRFQIKLQIFLFCFGEVALLL